MQPILAASKLFLISKFHCLVIIHIISEPELNKVILFTDKEKTSNLYKALSIDFHHSLSLGEIRNTEKALLEQYKVDKFPTLLVLNNDGTQTKYEGKLEHALLFKFLKPFAKQLQNQKASSEKAEVK